jgi:hypothetical protein
MPGCENYSSGSLKKVTKQEGGTVGSLFIEIEKSCPNDTIMISISNVLPFFQYIIPRNLHIMGNGIYNTMLDCQNATRAFNVNSNVNLTLENLTIAKANRPTDGGAFLNNGTVTLKNVQLQNNFEGSLKKAFTNKGSVIVAPQSTTILK